MRLLYDKNCNIIVCAGRNISKAFDCIEHYRDEHSSKNPFRIYEVSVSTTNQVKKLLHEMVS
jgi:DNA-binding protein